MLHTLLPPRTEACCAPERRNAGCHCKTLRADDLRIALTARLGADAYADLLAQRPHLFSDTAVFVSAEQLDTMTRSVRAIEAAIALPAFREAALGRACLAAGRDDGTRGAFMGYDFHLTAAGPRLIEVNTNAGGAFLNAVLADAQRACCGVSSTPADHFAAGVEAMFRAEHAAVAGDRPLQRVAITDDTPAQQYLYPEFLLARRMLAEAGIDTVIADAKDLRWHDGTLTFEGAPIDLVYNRLVDFSLREPHHAALRAAYESGAVAVTPNPRHHALFADKRNLVLLSDASWLRGAGLPAERVAALDVVPEAVVVTPANASLLWETRKNWFFKPASGHGSKAVYRGDKITRGVWTDVVAGTYVAQELAPPSERTVVVDGVPLARKVDVRLYTYRGDVLLAAARIYQGQTTNFRTPGGGFAPVFVV